MVPLVKPLGFHSELRVYGYGPNCSVAGSLSVTYSTVIYGIESCHAARAQAAKMLEQLLVDKLRR